MDLFIPLWLFAVSIPKPYDQNFVLAITTINSSPSVGSHSIIYENMGDVVSVYSYDEKKLKF